MRAIDFILDDVAKSRVSRSRTLALSFLLVLSSVGIGLGLREDYVEVFSWYNLLAPGLILILMVAMLFLFADPQNRSERKRLGASIALIVFALSLSLTQPHTEVSLRKFVPVGSFWPEALHCLLIGLLASLVSSLILAVGSTYLWPSANRRWRLLLAGVASLGGVAALTLHCMGPLYSHTLLAHWGQGLVFFPISYALQTALFRRSVQPVLGQRDRLKNLKNL